MCRSAWDQVANLPLITGHPLVLSERGGAQVSLWLDSKVICHSVEVVLIYQSPDLAQRGGKPMKKLLALFAAITACGLLPSGSQALVMQLGQSRGYSFKRVVQTLA